METNDTLTVEYENYPGEQGFSYETPPSYPPCVCAENRERFVSKLVVYCPYHGVESLHKNMPRRAKYHKRSPKNTKLICAAKVPPTNCLNGFIITFENQEEVFCRPNEVAKFFQQPIECQILDIVLTVNFLEANEVVIFQQTTRPTRATYFEIAQTPLDLEGKLKWAPLGPGYNYKYLVKQWYDNKGNIWFMERKVPSFQPLNDTEPLNCFYNESPQTDDNPVVKAPNMEVTFLGINNPWYYSRAVPSTIATKDNRKKQVRENHLTKDWLQEFDAYVDQSREGRNILLQKNSSPGLQNATPCVIENSASQMSSNPANARSSSVNDIRIWGITCPSEEYLPESLRENYRKTILERMEMESQRDESMPPKPKVCRLHGSQQQNAWESQGNIMLPTDIEVHFKGKNITESRPSTLSLTTTSSADNVLSLSVLDTTESEDTTSSTDK